MYEVNINNLLFNEGSPLGLFINGFISVNSTSPLPPVLLSPIDGAEKEPAMPILNWNVSGGTETYHLQLSTSLLFDSFVLDSSTITSTSLTVGPLRGHTKYYWWVQARNTNGQSEWSDEWNFTTENHSPIFISHPDTMAYEDIFYEYLPTVHDEENDTLLFSSSMKPSWLTVNSVSGLLSGTPLGGNVGDTSVVLLVSDGYEGEHIQTFAIHIHHTNHNPIIFPVHDSIAFADSLYQTHIVATDQDSIFEDVLKYHFIIKPMWLTIDSSSGLVTGTPGISNIGDTIATIRVTDNRGGITQYGWNIHIYPIDHVDGFGEVLPKEFKLMQNYPNPFNPVTIISYELPVKSVVTLKIYNILGETVATLLSNEMLDAGIYKKEYSAENLPSGTYFYRLF